MVAVKDGHLDVSLVHLPAPQISNGVCSTRFQAGTFAPSQWTSVCGVTGIVYNHAGPLAGAPVCAECRERQ